MSFAPYRDKLQIADEIPALAARYYLLNSDFAIISAHTGEENGVAATSFFDLFPTNRVLRAEIADYVRSYPQKALLTLCGRTPVLLVGTLCAHTGLVLAVLPQGTVKRTLTAPAAFHRVLTHISVSDSAQKRYVPHGEAEFAAACRWLTGVSVPFVQAPNAERELAPTLSFCASRLSQLFGVPMAADFSGLPRLSCTGVELEFATGVLLASLMAAQRSGAENGVRLYAAMESAPTLYLEYDRAESANTVSEFLPLLSCAAARGTVLDVVCPGTEPRRVQIRACIAITELSAQGVRERHRFLEGKSPLCALPQSHAILPPFPEFPFD